MIKSVTQIVCNHCQPLIMQHILKELEEVSAFQMLSLPYISTECVGQYVEDRQNENERSG